MLPIRDHNPSGRTPYVTWALIAANVAIFLAYYPAMSGDARVLKSFFFDWALIPSEISAKVADLGPMGGDVMAGAACDWLALAG